MTFALPHADRVYVLEHGRIIWEGDPARFALGGREGLSVTGRALLATVVIFSLAACQPVRKGPDASGFPVDYVTTVVAAP